MLVTIVWTGNYDSRSIIERIDSSIILSPAILSYLKEKMEIGKEVTIPLS